MRMQAVLIAAAWYATDNVKVMIEGPSREALELVEVT